MPVTIRVVDRATTALLRLHFAQHEIPGEEYPCVECFGRRTVEPLLDTLDSLTAERRELRAALEGFAGLPAFPHSSGKLLLSRDLVLDYAADALNRGSK